MEGGEEGLGIQKAAGMAGDVARGGEVLAATPLHPPLPAPQLQLERPYEGSALHLACLYLHMS
jgi:hypothetical protein